MSAISWNEIKVRAVTFSREWKEAAKEESEKQTFWNEFFSCFGIRRRLVASFEVAVKKAKGRYSFLDLFWPGMLLVEQKSQGASFEKAKSQAFAYMTDLEKEGRRDELPRYVILCDFQRFAFYDLEAEDPKEGYLEFPRADLHKHVRRFAFIKGEKSVRLNPEDPANFKATQLLADLHDALATSGYKGHDLERTLVRLLFCLFAEDTGIFDEPRCFTSLIERTREDGADLGRTLAELFDVLNTPEEKRQKHLDEDFAPFPYVNGGLFGERLGIAAFTSTLRAALFRCCNFEWAKISPAVFGSLFQDILDDRERRQVGAHYTSERDIMKLIRSLFLDNLWAELDVAKADRSSRRAERLRAFIAKLRTLRLFDPACGCGNFLIIAYRELRRLEMDALLSLHKTRGVVQRTFDIRMLASVDVDQFFGLEINEWPARIAEVGLWLTDHQCNVELAEAFGQMFRRLPLKASPTIHIANALRTDWRDILRPTDNVLVFGNPPFVGKKEQDGSQKADMALVWSKTKGAGILDYVTCWYRKAADYIAGTRVCCAFVSTNSITQGEQVGVLWEALFGSGPIKIHFAHRTFAWSSEARGKAHVHVVIIGFGAFDHSPKYIFDYEDPHRDPTVIPAANINPYLFEGGDTTVRTRTTPINGAPAISYGSMMIDKDREAGDEAGLILTKEHRAALLAECPALSPFIRRLYGGDEFLNGKERWCLWLVGAPPGLLRQSRLLHARIETVRAFRQSSDRPQTKALAVTPALFGEIRQPATPYLLIPKVSSESRRYIPIGFLPPKDIASGSALIVPDATPFHFGVLSSAMHMAWMRTVCGRMKSDYQYSSNIIYNNFPWPSVVLDESRKAIQVAAQAVLDARKRFSDSTLADLYDPVTMPPALVMAHTTLDRAVDRCYRKEPFKTDRQRVEYLFSMYEDFIAPLLPASPKFKGKKQSKNRWNSHV